MTAVESVTRVIDALDRLAIPYMVVGSFSSNIYGEPRSTKDADFVLQLGDTPIAKLANEIGADFVLDPQMTFETITATTRYRLRHQQTAFLIEFFLLSTDPHDQLRFSRRKVGVIGSRNICIPTVEDVMITKLRWSLHGKRQKDVDDVRNVMEVQFGKLDLSYIRHWCDQHGTRELFEKLLADAERFQQGLP
ncbi:MAG TPA: hypothetical protein VHD56_09305 [Tepidisphaeraceae bacterium]|nr:hypothetical protein [Tepidisphaeraceae bacterium]